MLRLTPLLLPFAFACASSTAPAPPDPHALHRGDGAEGIAVVIFDRGEQKVAFEPAAERDPFGGPTVTIWADAASLPRAPDGRPISGWRFTGWIENGRAKLAGFALVNRRGVPGLDLNGPWEPVLLDTWTGATGSALTIDAMRPLGAEPLLVRFLPSAAAFAHEHPHGEAGHVHHP